MSETTNLLDAGEQARIVYELAQKFARGKKSLVDFKKEFFPARDDVEAAPFHYKWSDALLHGKTHVAFEAFRESAKTTYVMRTFPLYCLEYTSYELEFIALLCGDEETARDKLSPIKADYKTRQHPAANLAEIIEDTEASF